MRRECYPCAMLCSEYFDVMFIKNLFLEESSSGFFDPKPSVRQRSPASDKDECFREMILIQFASTNLFPIYSLPLSPLLSPSLKPSSTLPSLPIPSHPAILCSPCLDVLICHYKKGYSRSIPILDARDEMLNVQKSRVDLRKQAR